MGNLWNMHGVRDSTKSITDIGAVYSDTGDR